MIKGKNGCDYFPNSLNLQLVESADVESENMEGQVYLNQNNCYWT